jgi:ADP-ribose pyrophosphatase YjhB (NUDIX family)
VAAAVVREVAEETGLEVVVDDLLGWVERVDDDEHFVILDFTVTVMDPDATLRPGDDATEAAWVAWSSLADYRLVPGLVEFLVDVGVIPDGSSCGDDGATGPLR